MQVSKDIFKAYDIRGLTPSQLNPHVAYAIGKAVADHLPAGAVAIGRDMRQDSAGIAQALIAGLMHQGRSVIDLGLITSDMMYFAVGKYMYAGGAMVTASHNPGNFDGIKLTSKGVVPIGIDTGLLRIEREVSTDHFKQVSNEGRKKKRIVKKDITHAWVEHATRVAGPIERPLQVTIDAGNGMASIVLPHLTRLKHLSLTGIYTELDGNFPHHAPNPLNPATTADLQSAVVKNKQDIGIAFDGDGDRAFFIDERGKRISASVVGAILASHILDIHPHSTMLYNAITSLVVADTIAQQGGKGIRTKVGHSFIKQQMKDTGAVFACEHSGHYYYKDNYGADSGLITALMMLHILSHSKVPFSQVASAYTDQYIDSEEINITATDHQKQEILHALAGVFADGHKDYLDGLTVHYPTWWFNARPSNTEPYLRINIEANDKHTLTEQKTTILKAIKPLT